MTTTLYIVLETIDLGDHITYITKNEELANAIAARKNAEYSEMYGGREPFYVDTYELED